MLPRVALAAGQGIVSIMTTDATAALATAKAGATATTATTVTVKVTGGTVTTQADMVLAGTLAQAVKVARAVAATIDSTSRAAPRTALLRACCWETRALQVEVQGQAEEQAQPAAGINRRTAARLAPAAALSRCQRQCRLALLVPLLLLAPAPLPLQCSTGTLPTPSAEIAIGWTVHSSSGSSTRCRPKDPAQALAWVEATAPQALDLDRNRAPCSSSSSNRALARLVAEALPPTHFAIVIGTVTREASGTAAALTRLAVAAALVLRAATMATATGLKATRVQRLHTCRPRLHCAHHPAKAKARVKAKAQAGRAQAAVRACVCGPALQQLIAIAIVIVIVSPFCRQSCGAVAQLAARASARAGLPVLLAVALLVEACGHQALAL